MALFKKSIKYTEILNVATEKASRQNYYGDVWTRWQMLQYLYSYYDRDTNVDFHEVIDIIDKLFLSGDLKA